MPDLPRGTVTFLFTDIEGSTRLLKRLGSQPYHEILATHQQLLRAVFEKAGGREIDTQGDAFFVAFHRAADAVGAAIAGQRALADHDWPEGVELRVRMGIDTGEPAIGEDRYVGLGVHRSARIMAAGHGGQVLVSGTTSDLVEDELPPEVKLRDLGVKRLKDLDRPAHIFQVVAPGLAEAFPPLRTLDSDEADLGWRGHRALLAAGVLAIAAGIAIAVFLLVGRSSGESAVIVRPNSLGVIDVKKNKVVQQIPVGDTPTSVEVGAGGVWVLNSNEQTVKLVDPKTRAVVRTIGVGPAPSDLAVGRAAVWVASASHRLVEIDPDTGVTVGELRIPLATRNPLAGGASASTVAADQTSVWATNNSTAAQIEPSPVRGFRITGFGCCNGIALGGGSVWVTDSEGVVRINPRAGTQEARILLTFLSRSIAVGAGAVWVTDQGGDTVWRIDLRTDRVAQTITVGQHPAGIAVGGGSVWVASADGTVSRIDPNSDRVVATIRVGGTPQDVAVGAGAVWVTVD
jgi:YVTN family beta-propeller protein